MLAQEDKDWIVEKLIGETKPMRDSVDLLRKKITEVSLNQHMSDMRLNSIEASQLRAEETSNKILNILDGFSGKVADLEQENKMGAVTLARHDMQIHEIADATGAKISE